VVTALGALVGLRLLFGPWEIGPVTLDTNSLAASALAILVGTELLWFGLFTRTVATIAGYLPRSRRLAALYDIFTLERGLAAGGASILLGLGLFAGVLWDWSATSFGALPRAESTRQMILALLFVLLGVQALFASFVLSLLGMAHDDGREGGDRS
jgi:hypothetical protein